VPDEPGHFYRAWSLSEGRLRAECLPDGRCGARLPAAVVRWTLEASARVVPGQVAAPPPPAEPDGRLFAEYRAAAQLPAPLHLPQALGVGLARLAGGSPAAALHAGRAASLLVVSGLLSLALGRLAWSSRPSALLLLLPGALALRASLSADAVQLALVMLFLAEAARGVAFSGEETSPSRLLWSLAGLGATKLVYAPLALLAWPATAALGAARRRRARLVAPLALALPLLLFAAESARLLGPLRLSPPVDPAENLAFHLRHPAEAVARVVTDLVRHAPRYAAEAVGSRLGWLDVEVSDTLVVVLFSALLLLAVGDRPDLPRAAARRFAAAAGFAAALAALALGGAMLVQWTPLAAAGLEGLQGRYFLPLALPLLATAAALPERTPRLPPRAADVLLALAALFGALSAVVALAARYG